MGDVTNKAGIGDVMNKAGMGDVMNKAEIGDVMNKAGLGDIMNKAGSLAAIPLLGDKNDADTDRNGYIALLLRLLCLIGSGDPNFPQGTTKY